MAMNPQAMEMAASALKNAAKTKPAQKSKLRMTINPTDNDRFVVDHDSTGPEGMGQPRMQHSLNDVDELVEHIKKNYSAKKAAKEEKVEAPAEKKPEVTEAAPAQ